MDTFTMAPVPRLSHRRSEGGYEEVGHFHIQAVDGVERCLVVRGGWTERGGPGVVDEDVDSPAQGVNGAGCEFESTLRVNEVIGHEDDRARSRTNGVDDGLTLGLVTPTDHDRGARCGQRNRGRLANAARAAGDERSLSGEVEHPASFPVALSRYRDQMARYVEPKKDSASQAYAAGGGPRRGECGGAREDAHGGVPLRRFPCPNRPPRPPESPAIVEAPASSPARNGTAE